jgi:TonB family protein
MIALLAPAFAQEPPPPPPADPAPAAAPVLAKDPVLLEFIQAPYPEEARVAGLAGSVGLSLEVDETGEVVRVEVVRAAGHGFDEAAVAAARQFRFSPAEDATGPVPVVIEFSYGFELKPEERPAVAEAPANLEGELLEMGTRRPLADVAVRVEPGGLETRTDPRGRWSFHGVPVGAVSLRVVHPGYDALTQATDVREGQATTVRLWLKNQNYADAGIVGVYRKEQADVTRRTITMEEIRRIPGTFGDPIRVVQTLPGAARSPLGTGLLIIRGSNPEDTGVYVDGIRIPYIYHLGGFESVINPDLVADVDYLPGGFGVAYGRGLGGVVDVTSRDEFPERIRATWSTDLLDSGGMVMGSLGRRDQHGFGVAARRSYIDAVLPAFLDTGFVVSPKWWDYQAKYRWQGGGKWKASLLVFGFRDDLIASTPPGYAQGTDQDTQGDLGTAYSTHRVLAEFERELGRNWSLRLVPAFGRDDASLVIGDSWRLEQGQWMVETRTEAIWTPSPHLRAVAGSDFIGGYADFSILLPYDPAQFAEVDPLAEREPFTISGSQPGYGPDPYLYADWRPLSDPERLLITPGVRFLFVHVPGELAVTGWDPRLAARWALLPTSVVKASVGLYHQPPQPYQSYRGDDQPVELRAEQALSTTLGWEQQLGPAIRADVEGFYKHLDDLIVDNPSFTSLDDQFFTNEGVGRIYGLEVMLRHDRVGPLFGWLSYTLSKSERRDHAGDDWYRFDFDQTHNLVGVAGYHFPHDWEVSVKGQYTTGNPYTPYTFGVYDVDQDLYQGIQSGAWNSERLPPYWSVSGRIDKLLTFRSWQLDLYLDLLNGLHGENPEFQLYNYDYTESTYISGLPFIPSPGFEARFEF